MEEPGKEWSESESEAHKAQNSHLLPQAQFFCSIALMSDKMGEERDKDQQPKTPRS